MPRFTLGKSVVKAIHKAVSKVFDKAKSRLLNRPFPKHLVFDSKISMARTPELSIPGIFVSSSIEERTKPNREILESIERTTEGYLSAYEERAKTQVVHAVESFLKDAHAKGVDTDVATVLGGELEELFSKLKSDMDRLANTECTQARNMGGVDGIYAVNATHGVDDPTVYFVVVKDNVTCDECKRLHLMPDGVTPRCWKMSELKSGYHKKTDNVPSMGGLHPHCRCSLVTLLPGYGFDKAGHVVFKGIGYDALREQRGLDQS